MESGRLQLVLLDVQLLYPGLQPCLGPLAVAHPISSGVPNYKTPFTTLYWIQRHIVADKLTASANMLTYIGNTAHSATNPLAVSPYRLAAYSAVL